MSTCSDQEPYKATKLWNEVILAFRTGMPLKRHRRRMRTYDDCFTGAECASWLNCYLKNNPNFGPDVTRIQTVQLLQKFLKCHVIDCLTSKTGKLEFHDNSHLYRFVQFSPIKSNKKPSLQILLRTPLASQSVNNFNRNLPVNDSSPDHLVPELRKSKMKAMELHGNESFHMDRPVTNHIPECHFIVKKLSIEEVENLWKILAVKRIDSVLHPNKTEDFLDKKLISGRTILHNVTRVSKSGVVTLLDKTDDIPYWVISAMKCLANWPNASGSGSCLPNYPGFEKDVFKVVRDFFINPEVPLVPVEFNPLIAHMLLIFKGSISPGYTATMSENNVSKVKEFNSCLGQKTSTPVIQTSVTAKTGSLHTAKIAVTEFSSQHAEGRIILDDPTVMWDYPMSVCYETEFTSSSPVTKVVPNYPGELSLQRSHLSSRSVNNENFGSLDTLSTISACSRATKNSVAALKDCYSYCSFNTENIHHNLSNGPKHASMDNLDHSSSKHEVLECHSLPVLPTLPRGYKIYSQSLHESKIYSSAQPQKRQNLLICEFRDYCDTSKSSSELHLKNTSSNVVEKEFFSDRSESIHSHNNSSHNDTLNATAEIWHTSSDQNGFIRNSSTALNNQNGCEPTSSKLCNTLGDGGISQEDYIFPDEVNKQMLSHRKAYMESHQDLSYADCFNNLDIMQNLTEIFQVLLIMLPPASRRQMHLLFRMIQKILRNGRLAFDSELPTKNFIPVALKEEVEIKLAEMRKGRIKYSLDDSCMLTYCELISQQQYDEQKVSLSRSALLELLEKILQDKSISDREKKKKLKQFKINHPEVYAARFQNINEGGAETKPKKPLLSRFISMRM